MSSSSSFGSPKSSSGSTPSESSGSVPDESSSGSSGYLDSSSSAPSESSGSDFCSWEIVFVVLYDPLHGDFTVNNTGTLPLTVMTVTIPLSYTLTPPTPFVIAAGAAQTFTVVSDTDDLTGVEVIVATDCGSQSFNFP